MNKEPTITIEEECRLAFIPEIKKQYENYQGENKEKKIEKEFRKKMLEANTIRNENIIFAAFNDFVFRFIMLFEKGYENWIPCRPEEKDLLDILIKEKRKNLKFSYIKLKENANILENIVAEVNQKLTSMNNWKVKRSLECVTLKEIKNTITEEKIVAYVNSTQEQEIEFIQKLWLISKLITNLLPKAVFSEEEAKNKEIKKTIEKFVNTLEILKKDWRKYIQEQTINSKEALVRKLLKEEEVLDLKEFKTKDAEYLEKFTEKELKNKIKNIKCKKTKELNLLRNKDKKINELIKKTKENFIHTEEELKKYKETLRSLNTKLLNKEYESFDEDFCERYGRLKDERKYNSNKGSNGESIENKKISIYA